MRGADVAGCEAVVMGCRRPARVMAWCGCGRCRGSDQARGAPWSRSVACPLVGSSMRCRCGFKPRQTHFGRHMIKFVVKFDA